MMQGIRLALLASSLLLHVSCGNIEADDQSGRKLLDPKLPKDTEAFFVNTGEYERSFNGSIIVWQDDADVDGIAGVAKVSDAIIENGVSTLKYIRDNVAPLKAEFDELYVQAKAKTVAYQTKSYGIAAEAAATWLAGADGVGGQLRNITMEYVAVAGRPLPPEAYTQASGWMVAYCEAKLWERAINKNLIAEEYRGRRPTPSAMCEGVYLKLGLINPEREMCKAGEEYKNYFACLWHEGVKKTILWQSRYPVGASDAGDKFAAVSDEVLKYNFAHENLGRDLLLQRRAGKIVDPKSGAETEVDLTFVSGPEGPASLSVQKIIRNIEFRPEAGDQFQIIPIAENEGDAKTLLETKNDWLRDQLTFFNKLSLGGYVNENRFNRIFQKDSQTKGDIAWTNEQQTEAAQRFPEVFVISNPELDTIKKELGGLQLKLVANGGKAQKALAPIAPQLNCPELPANYDPTKPLKGSYACMYERLSKEGIAVVKPKSVSQAVWQGHIKIRRDADQRILEVWVSPNKVGGQTHYGCTELTDDSKKFCPKDGSLGYGKAGIEIDEETGYFDIWAEIEDPSISGLGKSPRSKLIEQLTFSEIGTRKIRGNRVTFYATLNDIGDVLTTFLGDAAIKSPDGETLVSATIKMRDENPYYKVLADDYAKALMALQAAKN